MRRNIASLLLLPLTLACADDAPATQSAAPAERARNEQPTPEERGVVLFLGTSLTIGYGVGEDAAYPALIQEKIDGAGLPFRVVNAGLSGETSAGGLRRLDWSLQEPVEVLVLELGANDGLRGLRPDAMRANLDSILTRTRRRYPSAGLVVAGMEAPPNLGQEYTSSFRNAYSQVASKHGAALVPFLLEGVAGVASLNQGDRIHPNEEGQRRIAETVWRTLGPLLEERTRRVGGVSRE